jgi:hypothetical protein
VGRWRDSATGHQTSQSSILLVSLRVFDSSIVQQAARKYEHYVMAVILLRTVFHSIVFIVRRLVHMYLCVCVSVVDRAIAE